MPSEVGGGSRTAAKAGRPMPAPVEAWGMLSSTRRQFLATVLGTSGSLASCRRPSSPGLPPGQLLTPGKQAGHRLRDTPPTLHPEPTRRHSAAVVIVGAGVAGLAASWWLRRHGVTDLVVLDLDDHPGGTAQGADGPITPHPWGAHYLVAPSLSQGPLISLLQEVGAVPAHPTRSANQSIADLSESCRVAQPEERLFHAGRWHEGLYLHAGATPEDRRQYQQFNAAIDHWVSYRDAQGRRGFDLPASQGSTSATIQALDKISFSQWLDQQQLHSPRLRWLTNYACRDDYGLVESDTSAWAGIFYFAARLATAGGTSREVATWPEGNARLIAQLSAPLEGRLRLRHAVSDVRQVDNAVHLVASTPDGPIGFRAEHAIVATPSFIASRIVAARREAAPQPIFSDRGAWAVANLHLQRAPHSPIDQCPLAWDNVLHDSRSLGYVVANHQQLASQSRFHPSAPKPTIITWYYPFTGPARAARESLDSATREDWAAAALQDIAQAHPAIGSLCSRIDVAYWGHGMIRPRPGHIFHPSVASNRQSLGRIHFANTDLSGIALFEEAFAHGIRAAEEVLALRGPLNEGSR